LPVCRADPNNSSIDIDYRTDITNDCTGNVAAYVSFSLEVTSSDPPDPNSGWTTWDSTAPALYTFAAHSTTTLMDTFAGEVIPPSDLYYRVRAHIDQGGTCQSFDFYSDIYYVCTPTLAGGAPVGHNTPTVSPTMHHW
jgi:hypothetical protein